MRVLVVQRQVSSVPGGLSWATVSVTPASIGGIKVWMESSARRHLKLVVSDETEEIPRSDVDIVAAFRLRERGSAEALHDRVRPAVDRTILRLLRTRDADFDDLVQCSLIELVGSLGRWIDGSLEAWATTITARVVYKYLRRRKLERRIFERDFEPGLVRGCSDPRKEALFRSALRRIRAHLADLDEKKAWAFLLHDVFGHDVREVAAVMDASISASQQRLARGRRELHARLAADPELANVILEFGVPHE